MERILDRILPFLMKTIFLFDPYNRKKTVSRISDRARSYVRERNFRLGYSSFSTGTGHFRERYLQASSL
jgi:hypothetical protein